MQLPEKEWYSLHEVADRWGIPVKDVIHYLETGKLSAHLLLEPHEYELVTLRTGWDLRRSSKARWLFVLDDIQTLSWSHNGRASADGDELYSCIVDKHANLYGDVGYCKTSKIIERNIDSVFIISRELSSYENPSTDMINSTLSPFLDPTNPYYSNKLAAAVSAWIAIYGEGKLISKHGHKGQIIKWLQLHKKEYGDLSNQAIDEIAKVVNANPKGGAPAYDYTHYEENEKTQPTFKPASHKAKR